MPNMKKIILTEAEKQWVLDNYYNFNGLDFHKEFVKHFRNINIKALRRECFELGLEKRIGFSQEEDKWLLDNFDKYLAKDLLKLFNSIFNRDIKWNCFRVHLRQLGKSVYYTSSYTIEQKNWLIQNYDRYNCVLDLINDFNKTWGLNKDEYTLRKYLSILNLAPKQPLYTKEQKTWIHENHSKYNYRTLTKEFNKHFNTNKTMLQIQSWCRQNKLVKSIDKELYAIKEHNGNLFIKITSGKGSDNWYPYARYLYEQKYGTLPKNYRVGFLDGDNHNCDINNLIAVDKKVLAPMNTCGFWGNPDFAKQAADFYTIKYEIEDIIK